MHVLSAQAGRIDDGDEPVDLGQSPGDIVVLSSAESELSALASIAGHASLASSIRLASLLRLKHPYSVDLYVERTLSKAKVIAVRVIGGESYWSYGLDQITALARRTGLTLIVVPGEAQWDQQLARRSTSDRAAARRFWELSVEGGPENRLASLAFLDALARQSSAPLPSVSAMPRFGLCDPQTLVVRRPTAKPRVPKGAIPVVFYTSLLQAGTTGPIGALCDALSQRGLDPQPVFLPSLKEPDAANFVRALVRSIDPPVVVNTTAFAAATALESMDAGPLSESQAPVIQAVLSGASHAAWNESARGLPASDLVMHVMMPELDGRVHGRVISFKSEAQVDPFTEFAPVTYQPHQDHIDAMASTIARWCALRTKAVADKQVAFILANYPTKTSRIGNGVGLDTPASVMVTLEAMAKAGYQIDDAPIDGKALMDRLIVGGASAHLPIQDYRRLFSDLPPCVQKEVQRRWGEPGDDPTVDHDGFALQVHRFGQVWIGIQPARGYNVEPAETYHDPDLVPPHSYFAFYFFLRDRVDALVQFGKHGNLEWLPGKALGLSQACYPAAIIGDLPTIYPFIVNDPGEGCQAKRRTGAVIVDHLTPPLTRAGSHGVYEQLEALLDEYAQAEPHDARRAKLLAGDILGFARETGLADDIGLRDDVDENLIKLDTALCDLKELQIRDGLHVFGEAPEPNRAHDLLVAIARLPRGAQPEQASLLRALASDYQLPFDPLTRAFGEPWQAPVPHSLKGTRRWRTHGDAINALEDTAQQCVAGLMEAPGLASQAVLEWIHSNLKPTLDACAGAEVDALLAGLSGRFVPPGPAGAPSRARPDVLPTGRNFFAVDARAVPSPAAWRLGRQSADALLSRHFQDHGTWLRALVLTCWGTANMRTGGDDIAQALALVGVAPQWDGGSGRVTGFDVLPLSELQRPRVDVTLRISGFFRDAFPHQIDLFDSAVRAVADLDEPADMNPIAAHIADDRARFTDHGVSKEEAKERAAIRIFGSMPGAYGAGLQALIDEGGWRSRGDFADAFLAWGGFAYGIKHQGAKASEGLKRRLETAEAVVQNQDNREHDLLDSDDYYQFEGGLAATIETLSGRAPTGYHVDHSRPEDPVPRTLREEIGRVVRGRASNPKWIQGVMRHGYKGAFEMAATLDYLFAFAATTNAVTDHHFDALFEAYIADEAVRAFIADANQPALDAMIARFQDAIDRGLWQPRRNTTPALLRALTTSGEDAVR